MDKSNTSENMSYSESNVSIDVIVSSVFYSYSTVQDVFSLALAQRLKGQESSIKSETMAS